MRKIFLSGIIILLSGYNAFSLIAFEPGLGSSPRMSISPIQIDESSGTLPEETSGFSSLIEFSQQIQSNNWEEVFNSDLDKVLQELNTLAEMNPEDVGTEVREAVNKIVENGESIKAMSARTRNFLLNQILSTAQELVSRFPVEPQDSEPELSEVSVEELFEMLQETRDSEKVKELILEFKRRDREDRLSDSEKARLFTLLAEQGIELGENSQEFVEKLAKGYLSEATADTELPEDKADALVKTLSNMEKLITDQKLRKDIEEAIFEAVGLDVIQQVVVQHGDEISEEVLLEVVDYLSSFVEASYPSSGGDEKLLQNRVKALSALAEVASGPQDSEAVQSARSVILEMADDLLTAENLNGFPPAQTTAVILGLEMLRLKLSGRALEEVDERLSSFEQKIFASENSRENVMSILAEINDWGEALRESLYYKAVAGLYIWLLPSYTQNAIQSLQREALFRELEDFEELSPEDMASVLGSVPGMVSRITQMLLKTLAKIEETSISGEGSPRMGLAGTHSGSNDSGGSEFYTWMGRQMANWDQNTAELLGQGLGRLRETDAENGDLRYSEHSARAVGRLLTQLTQYLPEEKVEAFCRSLLQGVGSASKGHSTYEDVVKGIYAGMVLTGVGQHSLELRFVEIAASYLPDDERKAELVQNLVSLKVGKGLEVGGGSKNVTPARPEIGGIGYNSGLSGANGQWGIAFSNLSLLVLFEGGRAVPPGKPGMSALQDEFFCLNFKGGRAVPPGVGGAYYPVYFGHLGFTQGSNLYNSVEGLPDKSAELGLLLAPRVQDRDFAELMRCAVGIGKELYFAYSVEGDLLGGLSLSGYYSNLLFFNSVTQFIMSWYKDLSRLGALREISFNWENFMDFVSPQAIIKEILKKLQPRKTKQRARLKLVFPSRISLTQFLVIFFSMAVFAITFGYAMGRYYLALINKNYTYFPEK
jgi:hypothetical protein